MTRRIPYTVRGISRVPCARCKSPARYQWQICADGNVFRGLCPSCDVAINEIVMRFVFGDTREEDLQRYRQEKLA